MVTKATQTHFRGIRLSSQEIAILAKRPIGCTDSVNRLEDYVLVSIQRGPRGTVPDVAARGAAAYLGLSKNQRLTELCRKIDAGGDGGRRSPKTSRPLVDVMQKVRFWDPEHWRFRAEETRTVADQMTHEESRAIMRRIANDYDRLAKLAEEQLADQERGAIGRKS
jgi:hypothetical protein